MTSTSSKMLPYLSIVVGLILAGLAAAGYGEKIDAALGVLTLILPITASGGLINKAIEASIEKKKAFVESGKLDAAFKELATQIEQAKK